MGGRRVRDGRYEWLRVGAMLCILLCHAVAHLPWRLEDQPGWRGALAVGVDQYAGQVGVSMFFMLSGFFLARRPFTFQRPVKVVVQTFCYSAACTLIALFVYPHMPALMHPDMPWRGRDLAYYLYMGLAPTLNDAYWFITAYVLMILFSPLANLAFRRLSSTQILWFMAVAGFLSVMPYVTFSGFAYNGLFWTTPVYALLCYAAGGWIRLYGAGVRARVSWPLAVGYGLVAFLALSAFIHAAQEQGPLARFLAWKPRSIYGTIPLLAVVFSAMVLLLVSAPRRAGARPVHGARGGSPLSGLGGVLGSTVFGVYLIHQNWLIGNDVWRVAGWLAPEPQGALRKALMLGAVVVVSFVVLAVCSWCFDRVLVTPVQRLVSRLLAGSAAERFAAGLSDAIGREDAVPPSRRP